MEELYSMLRLRSPFLIILLSLNLFGIEVVMTSSKINYKEIVSSSKLAISDVNKVKNL